MAEVIRIMLLPKPLKIPNNIECQQIQINQVNGFNEKNILLPNIRKEISNEKFVRQCFC